MKNFYSLRFASVALIFLFINTSLASAASILYGAYDTYSAGSPHAVGVGDFNHDGLADVVLSNSEEELILFIQNNSGELNNAATLAAGSRPEALAVGDLNNDGWDDIVVTNFSNNIISVFLQQEDGTLAPPVAYTTGNGPDAVTVGDINGDGKDDVAVSNWNSAFISIFIQNASGTLNSKVDYASPQAGRDDIAIGDVNGDGLNDVVKMNGQIYTNPDISVYLQSGGVLQNAVSYSITGNIFGQGIGIGDVTGDGKADVVMSYGGNRPSSFIAVFAQAVDGTLQSAVSYESHDVPEALEVADVNEDGLSDVIVAHGGWNTTSVFTQQVDGSLGSYALYALPKFSASHYKPQSLTIGDVNSDNLPDILVANSNFGLNVLRHLQPPAPIPPFVVSIVRAETSPTNTSNVNFTINFSEPVTGVDGSDFLLAKEGSITGESIAGVTPVSASVYTVTVNTGSGNGTLRLDIPDTASIKDTEDENLSDIPFTSGETYVVMKSPPKPVSAPLPSQPKRNNMLNSSTPTFVWNEVVNAVEYEIVISTNASFSQVILTENTSSPSFTPIDPLVDGKYFWRVRAYNSAALPSKFSVTQSFTIDTTPPPAPSLTSPADAATLRSFPLFRWSRVSGAVLYEFQYDNDADLSSPTYSVTTKNNSHRPPAMPNGTYFWRVRAQDAAGNWGPWSLIRSFTLSR